MSDLRERLAKILRLNVTLGLDAIVSNVPGLYAHFNDLGYRTYQGASLRVSGLPRFGGGHVICLYGGVVVMFYSSPDTLFLGGGYAIDVGGGEQREVWSHGELVRPGSSLEARLFEEIISGLYANAERAAVTFVNSLPST